MSTVTIATEAAIIADAEAVIAALTSGKEIDPVIAQRIHERSVQVRERILREHGTVHIAVPSIRELRDA